MVNCFCSKCGRFDVNGVIRKSWSDYVTLDKWHLVYYKSLLHTYPEQFIEELFNNRWLPICKDCGEIEILIAKTQGQKVRIFE
jgi:hypothetical protein